jgi:putative endonuclease
LALSSQTQAAMNQSKRAIGSAYEEKAAQYLESKKYRILEKNVNYRWGEIDLVAIDLEKNELVFVEVRHRAENSMTRPEESMSKSKITRLKRAIDTYLVSPQFSQKGLKLSGIRIDLFAFTGEKIDHWKNFV